MTRSKGRGVSRRRFMAGVGALSAPAAMGAGLSVTQSRAPRSIYEELGVRPFINAAGTYTALSGSLLHPEVRSAMEEASRAHVSIEELQRACGERIASLTGAQAALVTSGCAAALMLATAACVCGEDEAAIKQVPDTTGLKNEVIFVKEHRFGYDHAIRNVGVDIIDAESATEIRDAISERTAMLFFLNFAEGRSAVSRQDLVAIGKEKGVPTLLDAAADLPPVDNLRAYIEMGYDLVAYSGGKALRGPQCSGLLVGRKDLIAAAYRNGPPNGDTVGRIAKVGKEEIVGVTRAVEIYADKDHGAEWERWESHVRHIQSAVADVPGVRSERFVPEIANAVPHVAIEWDQSRIDMTRADFAQALSDGEPRIEVRPSDPLAPRLEIGVWMMDGDEYRIVAGRCAEVLQAAL